MIGRARRLAALLLAALPACAESPAGPLDRETLLTLLETHGDARGRDHSGTWSTQFDLVECTCPEDFPLVCYGVELPMPLSGSLQLVQSDGVLLARAVSSPAAPVAPLELLGPLQQDGSFSLALVELAQTVGVSSWVHARFDGAFEPAATADAPATHAAGTLEVRTHVHLGVALEGRHQDTVCGATYEIVASR
ncbi:MAG: hypothetical protein K1X88_24825 [Nannocystaceae bacterium]|nr:hypothetical protein [Nannocystaceae bacterium]